MALMMKRYFEGMLVVPPVDPNKDALPSPEDLMYKILVKAKKVDAAAAARYVFVGCGRDIIMSDLLP